MNNPQTILLRLDDDYTLLYDPKNTCTPYNVAYGYNEEKNIWGHGNYCVTLEGALVCYLRKMNNPNLKSKYQIDIEDKRNITYERMGEIASAAIQNLSDDSDREYFLEDCELTEDEKYFFGIDWDDECSNNYTLTFE